MSAAPVVRFKICCMGSVGEIELAVRYGASAVGFVSSMPSGAGIISNELIARLVPRVPPGVGSFLLTSERTAVAIIEQQRAFGAGTIQIVDSVPPGVHEELRRRLRGISIVQVVHVTGDESVAEAIEVAPRVHAILLDSGNPSLEIKELGGTGRVHDWKLSRRIVETVNVPVFLAGGLNPDNVGGAIRAVRPYAVDVCTGVRTNGSLDETK